jgi:hypothetical protein
VIQEYSNHFFFVSFENTNTWDKFEIIQQREVKIDFALFQGEEKILRNKFDGSKMEIENEKNKTYWIQKIKGFRDCQRGRLMYRPNLCTTRLYKSLLAAKDNLLVNPFKLSDFFWLFHISEFRFNWYKLIIVCTLFIKNMKS